MCEHNEDDHNTDIYKCSKCSCKQFMSTEFVASVLLQMEKEGYLQKMEENYK